MAAIRNSWGPGLVVALAGTVAAAAFSWGADSDLWVEVVGPRRVFAGQPATFTVRYGNRGPDAATSAYVNLELPVDVPVPLAELTQEQRGAIQASAADTDSLGNVPRLFTGYECDALLLQDQGPGDENPVPMQAIEPGTEGAFSVTVTFPLEPVPVVELRVLAPPDLARTVINLGRPVPPSCNEPDPSCLGAPLSQALQEGEAILADDGSQHPSYACNPLGSEAAGRIAIIERGDCQFETKAFNAQAAGAIGAVIVNNSDCLGAPSSPDCVLPLGCGDLGVPVTLPTVMISQADGTPLVAALRAGREVRVSFGGQPTRRPMLTGQVFQSSVSASDPNPADNKLQLEILLDLLPPVGPVRRGPAGRVGG